MMTARRGATLGLLLLALVAFFSGFYTLNEGEAAVVSKFFGMEVRVVEPGARPALETPFGPLYWHLPWPLEVSHKVGLGARELELADPMVFSVSPNYYLIMTKDGFRYAYPGELADLNLMVLHVRVRFRVTNLTAWANVDRFGGGEELVERYLTFLLHERAGRRIGEIFDETSAENPEADAGTLWGIVRNKVIQDPGALVEGLQELILEYEVESGLGIKILGIEDVELLEEPMSKYL